MSSWHRGAAVACLSLLWACGGGEDEAAVDPAATNGDAETSGDAETDVGADSDPELGGHASAAVAEHELPALGVAALDGGSVRVAVAGRRSYGSSTSLTSDVPFHLGSNGKAMTATLLATFVDEGAVSLDATLGDVFSDVDVHESLRDASLRDVLAHGAGLGDEQLDLPQLHAAEDHVAARADVVAKTLRQPATGVSGFRYANVNYMLVGAVTERLGGSSWETLVSKRIFEPLGMDCGFGAPTGPAVPLGHAPAGQPIPDDAPVTDNPPALRPAGGVHCSLASWSAFVDATLDHARGEGSKVISASAAADLFAGDGTYVAGWQRRRTGSTTTLAHDGSNTLWYARAVLQVEDDRALLLVTNTGEPKAVQAIDDLTRRLLDEN